MDYKCLQSSPMQADQIGFMKTANRRSCDCFDIAHCGGVETWYFPSNIGRVNMDIPLPHKQPLMSMWSRQHADVIAQTSFFAGFWDCTYTTVLAAWPTPLLKLK